MIKIIPTNFMPCMYIGSFTLFTIKSDNGRFQIRSHFYLKVPINPKLLFCLNKYMYNSEQNGAKIFDLGQNRNFL